MYLLPTICGFTIGIAFWCGGSIWIATSLERVETRHPELTGTRRLRVAEGVACGALFFACIAVALGVGRLVWLQMK